MYLALLISKFFVFSLLSFFTTCSSDKAMTGYDLNQPDMSLELPEILHEVSGLTDIDATTVACVQDEKGILFIYDLTENKIKKQFTFNIDGDYEGITRVDETLYILRSDGALFELADYDSEDFKLTTYATGIPAKDNEGLCYDPRNNRLLIACKSKPGKGSQYKDRRAIYSFDLDTKTTSKEPVFDFDLNEIKRFAIEQKIDLPMEVKKGRLFVEPAFKFRASAIGLHPLKEKLYLFSASDHLLFIFNMNGEIEYIQQLDAKLFKKAEGITFFENGDMVVSNEGESSKPTFLRFKYNSALSQP